MLSIRNPEVERIARYIAKARGTSMTTIILDALLYQETVETKQAERRKARIQAIAARCASAPDLDTRSPEIILGYDEAGGLGDGNR